MQWSVVIAGLVMGLVGGPHCLAMCAAPCAAFSGQAALPTNSVIATTQHRDAGGGRKAIARYAPLWGFHVGRWGGYAAMGALAAYSVQHLAWFSDRTSVLYPVWVLFHLAALVWGLGLLLQARQPLWVERGGQWVWSVGQKFSRKSGAACIAGVCWSLLPCGLLYSALFTAALAGSVQAGALAMLAFAMGSGLWLLLGPWLVRRAMQASLLRQRWGYRFAGALLVVSALWALWRDMVQAPAQWCR